ncbi:hypothetical protein [Leptolyngbya sp. Heron Island J]|nr:hypothetical protein [Leptolyngbya sp. Heron Island J]
MEQIKSVVLVDLERLGTLLEQAWNALERPEQENPFHPSSVNVPTRSTER